MFKIIQFSGVILIFGCLARANADQNQPCNTPAKPICKCNFAGDDVEIEPNTSGNEALVGVVSAMSSLLVTGSGIGLYMLLKGKCNGSKPDFNKSNSSLSDNSLRSTKNKTGPRNYGNAPGSEKGTNVYRSALSDNVNHRSGRLGTANSYTKGTLSDWT